jgi:hypothetical protein
MGATSLPPLCAFLRLTVSTVALFLCYWGVLDSVALDSEHFTSRFHWSTKNQGTPLQCRCQKGDMKQAPYCWSTILEWLVTSLLPGAFFSARANWCTFFRARDKDLSNYSEMLGAVLQNLVYRATRRLVFVHSSFRNALLRVSFEEIFATEFVWLSGMANPDCPCPSDVRLSIQLNYACYAVWSHELCSVRLAQYRKVPWMRRIHLDVIVGLLLWSKGVTFYRPCLVLARDRYVCYAGLLLLSWRDVSTDSYNLICVSFSIINVYFYVSLCYDTILGGTRWRSCLRHCATRREVAGSIPDGVIGIFYWHTMALG